MGYAHAAGAWPGHAGRLTRAVVSSALVLVLGRCAGPQSLRVAIDPHDESAYVALVNEFNLNGRLAFADWMAKERGISTEEVLRRDAELSSTRNPFDAHRDRQAVSRGAVIYKIHCLKCHGEDARGHGPATLPDYPANDFKKFSARFAATLHRGAPRKWFRVIRDGAGEVVHYPDQETTAMPSFSKTLAREQIWLVITYLQSLDVHAPHGETERG
ncbi:MAG: c-type cytochrome [Phycisphaerae bacterium]